MTETKTYARTPRPRSTPWGRPDVTREVAPGIWLVCTPSHGGHLLSPERNADVLEHLRLPGGEYEEDCDWARVVVSMPDVFRDYFAREFPADAAGLFAEHLEHARITLRQAAEWRRLDAERAALLAAGDALRTSVVRIEPGPDGRKRLRAIFQTVDGGRHAVAADMDADLYETMTRTRPETETYRAAAATAAARGLYCGPLVPYAEPS